MKLLTGETQKIFVITKIDYEPTLKIELDKFGYMFFNNKTDDKRYLMIIKCWWKHASVPEPLKLIVDETLKELYETPEGKTVFYYKDKYYCYWCNSNIFSGCSIEETGRELPMESLDELGDLEDLMESDYNRNLILDYDLTDTVSELAKKHGGKEIELIFSFF